QRRAAGGRRGDELVLDRVVARSDEVSREVVGERRFGEVYVSVSRVVQKVERREDWRLRVYEKAHSRVGGGGLVPCLVSGRDADWLGAVGKGSRRRGPGRQVWSALDDARAVRIAGEHEVVSDGGARG